jgi:malate dehydrogenase (oxaloacetate-decarboxylating)(NADP+)
LMGMSKPVHVLQRGAEVEEIVNIAAIAVVDAQETEKQTAMPTRLEESETVSA